GDQRGAVVALTGGTLGEHEDRGVEGWGLAPPALPLVILPRAALGTELVATHDLGTDVARHVAGEVVVEPSAAAGVSAVHPACGGAGPREEVCGVGVPEGVVQALAVTGTEPVSRHVEASHPQQLRHS